jgi:hypothetical protein
VDDHGLTRARVGGVQRHVAGREHEVRQPRDAERTESPVVALVVLRHGVGGVDDHEHALRSARAHRRPDHRGRGGGPRGHARQGGFADQAATGVRIAAEEPDGEGARGDRARIAHQRGDGGGRAFERRIGLEPDVRPAQRQVGLRGGPDAHGEVGAVVVLG